MSVSTSASTGLVRGSVLAAMCAQVDDQKREEEEHWFTALYPLEEQGSTDDGGKGGCYGWPDHELPSHSIRSTHRCITRGDGRLCSRDPFREPRQRSDGRVASVIGSDGATSHGVVASCSTVDAGVGWTRCDKGSGLGHAVLAKVVVGGAGEGRDLEGTCSAADGRLCDGGGEVACSFCGYWKVLCCAETNAKWTKSARAVIGNHQSPWR